MAARTRRTAGQVLSDLTRKALVTQPQATIKPILQNGFEGLPAGNRTQSHGGIRAFMIALLDASVLIALFDAAHIHHQETHHWFSKYRSLGWAACPLTQNACIRIISQPTYPGRLPIGEIARRLRQATSASDHYFWPDSISLCDESLFAYDQILTANTSPISTSLH